MFTRVFHIRTKNTNARPKKWREATIKARNDVNTSANEEAGDTKPAEPEKIPERIRIDQEPRQLLEEDWLLPLALVCRENYYFSQHYGTSPVLRNPLLTYYSVQDDESLRHSRLIVCHNHRR